MTTIHLVSHTHWDREWYQPFQLFRLRLVHLVDRLLDLMADDPRFLHFTLDGQTIVLDDYLQMRPERESELRALVQSGRLVIGPWHILPDEFLVSPEATVRNLLQGDRTARRFGPKMQVGYIPDPFGHIGQMPQILQGFGIAAASVERGLDDQPAEFWWEAPDGSRVFMAYLRDGYGNAVMLPADREGDFAGEVARLRDSLLPYAASGHVLLMHGTDHTEPPAETAAAVAYTNTCLNGDRLVHSTLPAYLAQAQAAIREQGIELPVLRGELRSSKRFHLLPGVLSARMWIKQRNQACETLLEKWAEPFSTFAAWTRPGCELPDDRKNTSSSDLRALHHTAPLLRQAWRYLMENHPHDSICGCSIDQVHAEMLPRFDQVEQIGEEITRQSLQSLCNAIDTRCSEPAGEGWPVVVFNPHSTPVTGPTSVWLPLPVQPGPVELTGPDGETVRGVVEERQEKELACWVFDRAGFIDQLALLQDGKVAGFGPHRGSSLQAIDVKCHGTNLLITVTLADSGEPSAEALAQAGPVVMQAVQNPEVTVFTVQVLSTQARVRFVAAGVPPCGYKTFQARSVRGPEPTTAPAQSGGAVEIRNEFFSLHLLPDGALALTDLRSGTAYPGLNRFVDGADCGDEYNYSPPAEDRLVDCVTVLSSRSWEDPASSGIELTLCMDLPARLDQGRCRRADETVPLLLTTRAMLYPGVPRLDIHTRVENRAEDHRLRVHFPAPLLAQRASYDGHFEVVERPIALPEFDSTWVELPRPEKPQRAFTSLSDGRIGLTVANRGLPEVEVIAGPRPHTREIALTLLRCVGWLSRDDFSTRKGHAGPGYATPGAQMQGVWEFDYSVIPHPGDWRSSQDGQPSPAHQAYAFQAPLRAMLARPHPGRLPAFASLISCTPPAFSISAVKETEDGRGWIVRGYNLDEHPIAVRLACLGFAGKAWVSNLAERRLAEISPSAQGVFELDLRGHEIATLRFEP